MYKVGREKVESDKLLFDYFSHYSSYFLFFFFFGDSNLIDALYSLSVSRKFAFIKNGSRERRVKSASRLKKGRRYFVPKTPDEKNSLAIRAGREEERKGREETRKRGRMGPHTRAIKLPAFFNSS